MTSEIIKSQFKILFVDDEENARKYFDKGLKHNFNVLTAASVDEAIKVLQEQNQTIAVVITDQRMPGGNGVKLLKFLRENYPHIIRLLTTAYSDLTEAIDAVNSGEIFRYIQKPWDYNLLQTELKQALALFELRLEYNKLLGEKIMVKKKITKIERAKSLLLTAKSFDFLRFSDIAAQNFIKKFAVGLVDEEQENEEWKSFDFGNGDVLETKFFLNLIEQIQSQLKSSQDYSFNESCDSAKLTKIFASQKNLKIADDLQFQINASSFAIMTKKISEIAATTNAEISVNKSGLEVWFSFDLIDFLQLKKDNIFTQIPQKNAEIFYVNLLIGYFVAAHHGGFIDLVPENQNLKITIKLPQNPSVPIFSNDKLDSLENTILSVMII